MNAHVVCPRGCDAPEKQEMSDADSICAVDRNPASKSSTRFACLPNINPVVPSPAGSKLFVKNPSNLVKETVGWSSPQHASPGMELRLNNNLALVCSDDSK
jgi:hypothetical protein